MTKRACLSLKTGNHKVQQTRRVAANPYVARNTAARTGPKNVHTRKTQPIRNTKPSRLQQGQDGLEATTTNSTPSETEGRCTYSCTKCAYSSKTKSASTHYPK